MKRFKSIVLTAVAVLVTVAFALPTPPASAQSASLSISPKKTYVIEAGKSVNDKLTIHNLDASGNLDLTLRVVDFTYTDNGGTPKLMIAQDAPQTTWSLKPFLTVPKSVSIPPSGTKTLDITTAIPAGHGAGSYYSAILYSTGTPDGGNVGLSASGVTLVFVSVPGKVNEDLSIKKLGAYDPTAQGSEKGYMYVTGNEPTVVAYTLENKGDVTESPVGSITLKDLFGRTTTIDDVNPTQSLALIGQTRTFSACIKKKNQDVNFQGSVTEATTCTPSGLWPGYYSVSADLFYGQNGNTTQEITKTASFWYLPMWFVIAMLVVILVIAFVVWRIVVKIKGDMKAPRIKKRRK